MQGFFYYIVIKQYIYSMANGKHSRLGTLTNMLHKARTKNRKMQSIGYRKATEEFQDRFSSFWDRLRFLVTGI